MMNPWKQAGLTALNLFCVVAVIAGFQLAIPKNLFPDRFAGILLAILVFATYISASKWIEHRTTAELDLRSFSSELPHGFALGILLFAGVMGVLLLAGVYHPAGFGAANGLAAGFVSSAVAAITEEILFRGLLFRLIAKLLGTWGALILTSSVFGVAHAFNPGATISSSVAIALEAGILLGAAYAATGRLWLPIGLHLGWNFTEGSIFSMSVSGHGLARGLIRGSLTGPQILTGGRFGPEASIVAVIVCLLAAAFFILRVLKLNLTEPPAWRKALSDRATL
jgi:membrane protease YdiL (CAAX protease family)